MSNQIQTKLLDEMINPTHKYLMCIARIDAQINRIKTQIVPIKHYQLKILNQNQK